MPMYVTHTFMGFNHRGQDQGDDTPNVTRVLSGHVSPETGYVVDGRNCKVRHWLEYNPKRGLRWVAQTTNPRKGGVWDKTMAATYGEHGGALYLDEKGRVQFCIPLGFGHHGDEIRAAWWAMFGDGVPEVARHLKDKRTSLVGVTHIGA
jgi:hypothetical protein